MSQNTSPANKWLSKLQQESWELELLISGFSIFLMIKSVEWLSEITEYLFFHFSNTIPLIILGILLLFSKILINIFIINLLSHLFLRGFWVGIVGLGSVAPKTDISLLKYSPYFTNKLEGKILSLDDLVTRIDKVSSLIFSFTFLVMFYIISIAIYLIIVGLVVAFLVFLEEISPDWMSYVYISLLGLFLLSGIIYFIDFFMMGILRRKNWSSKIIYPVYWFYNTITLTFIYRTIYYNLITKFSKKKIFLILFPYLFITLVAATFSIDAYKYFPDNISSYTINQNNYSSLRSPDKYIETVDIPDQIISGGYIPLFIRYDVDDNNTIQEFSPDVKPRKSLIKSIFNIKMIQSDSVSEFSFSINTPPETFEDHPEQILKGLSSIYSVYIDDSLYSDLKYYFQTHKNKEEKGLTTMLDVSDLERGEHHIIVYKNNEEIATVQVWVDK